MKKIIVLLIILTSLFSCKSTKIMTTEEIKLITSNLENTPYRVLTIDNVEDSLFLRKKSKDVDNINSIKEDQNLQLFIKRLKLTMIAKSGVGIAAPQVGIGRNIFLFLRIDKHDMPVQVAINPKIVKHSDDTFEFEGDGCLSIPEQRGNTKRYEWIEVEFYDENGELHQEKLYGNSRGGDFTGIIFQHEYDHLEGILFTDRLCETKP